jgi:hypothetical protein
MLITCEFCAIIGLDGALGGGVEAERGGVSCACCWGLNTLRIEPEVINTLLRHVQPTDFAQLYS